MIILYILIGLILLFAILAMAAPRSYAVERDIVIHRPRPEVYDYVRSLKKQDEWSVWGKRDPDMKKSFSGTDGEVGAITTWEGNKQVGTGEQEITGLVENERVETRLRFIKPWKSESDAYFALEDAGEGSTKVRWGFTGEMKPPMNIMMLFMNMDKSAGKDFESGLASLKEKVEEDRS